MVNQGYSVIYCLFLVLGLRTHLNPHAQPSSFCMSNSHLSCCSIPSVPVETITVEYDVMKTESVIKPYNVTAVVTWDPPTNDADYSYSVGFSPLFTEEDVKNFEGRNIDDNDSLRKFPCDDKGHLLNCNMQRFEINVNRPKATFGDLLFGFPYIIRLQVIANGTTSATLSCSSALRRRRIITPDCFETTENFDYCKNQTIPFSSVPRDLTVDIELPRTSEAVILYVSWKPPLFVNGHIEHTMLAAYIHDDRSESSAYCADIANHTNFVKILDEDGMFLRNFTYEFMVTPLVVSPEEFEFPLPHKGNPAVRRIYIPETIITATSSIDTTTTTKATSEPPSNTQQPFLVYIIAVTVAVVLTFTICLLMIRLGKLRNKTKKKEQPVFSINISHHASKAPVRPEFKDKEIVNIYDVELSEETIGSGQFGEVLKATLNVRKGNVTKQTVAVKKSKDDISASLKEEFLDEIRLMIEIGLHPNILPLLACRTVAEPYYLITEYMKYGSLKDFLHKSGIPEIVSQDPNYDLTDLRKLQFSHQISKGMEYLATTRFFHGDLAARNVLINEEVVAKISDFGLSNDIYAKGYFRLPEEQKRPVKWYSPEANQFGKCSTEGDVWSFGIVLYEIYSGGQEPYPGMLPREVVVRVKAGYRMERPENCPNQIYIIMRDCWQHDPADRPSFELIRQTLEEMLSRGDDPYFDPIGEHEGGVHDDSSIAESVDRVSMDSFTYDATVNITNSRMIPYIDEN